MNSKISNLAYYYGIQVNQTPNNVVGIDWKVRSK